MINDHKPFVSEVLMKRHLKELKRAGRDLLNQRQMQIQALEQRIKILSNSQLGNEVNV